MPSLAELSSKVRIIYEMSGVNEAANAIRSVASAQAEATKSTIEYVRSGESIQAQMNNLARVLGSGTGQGLALSFTTMAQAARAAAPTILSFTSGLTSGIGALSSGFMGTNAGAAVTGIAAITAGYLAAGAAIALLVKSVTDGIGAYTKFEQVQTTTSNLLQATNYSSGLTASAIEKISVSLGGNIDQARAATQAMLQFTNVGGAEFERATVLAQKLAQSGFGSISSAAKTMGRFLSDEQGSLKAIGDTIYSTWGVDKIQRIEDMSNAIEKQRAKLDLLEQSLRGSQPSSISNAWENLSSAIQIGSEAFGEGAAKALRLADAINMLARAVNYLNSIDLGKVGAAFAGIASPGGLARGVRSLFGYGAPRSGIPEGITSEFGMTPDAAVPRLMEMSQQSAQWNAAANKAAGLIKEYEDISSKAAEHAPTTSYSYNAGDMRVLQYEQQIAMAKQELSLVNQTTGAQEQARRTLQAYYQLRMDSLRTGNPFDQKAFDQIVKYNAELGKLVNAREVMQQVSSAIEGPMATALTDVTTGTKKFGDAFRGAAQQIIRAIEEMIIKMYILKPLMSAIGGVFTPGSVLPSAFGNVFSGGELLPFASGGVISQPVIFPMARGYGLAGEAGPEAIMPLRRGPDGRLGVSGSGGGSVSVTNNVSVAMPYNAKPGDGERFGNEVMSAIDLRIRAALLKERRAGGLLASI